jgi:hypothetical protein
LKKDLSVVIVLAALAVAAFFLTAEHGGAAVARRGPLDPYRPDAKDNVLVRFQVEGGVSQIPLFEVSIRAPGDCGVRYQIRGRPVVERSYPLSDAQFHDILDRLARVEFFEVEDVPRSGYLADLATTTIALTIRDQQNTLRIDARRRPSRDLAPVLEFFEEIRKAATPEPVSTGD